MQLFEAVLFQFHFNVCTVFMCRLLLFRCGAVPDLAVGRPGAQLSVEKVKDCKNNAFFIFYKKMHYCLLTGLSFLIIFNHF